jgi:hypothetical protein
MTLRSILSSLAVAAFAAGCSGAPSGKDAGGGAGSEDAGLESCVPGPACPAVDKTCLALADNSGVSRPGLRMTQLDFSKPGPIASGLVKGVLSNAVLPSLPACNVSGAGTFSWLLRFDLDAGTLETGAAQPGTDGGSAYSFDAETIGGAQVRSSVLAVDFTGARFSTPAGADVMMPAFTGTSAGATLVLPLRSARLRGTLSANRSCIGTYNAATLDPAASCLPDGTHPAFDTSQGDGDAFISLADADAVIVPQLQESLCVYLSGDPFTYGDGQTPAHCKRDVSTAIVFAGDWCSTTDQAAAAGCHDAVQVAFRYAAAGVAIAP